MRSRRIIAQEEASVYEEKKTRKKYKKLINKFEIFVEFAGSCPVEILNGERSTNINAIFIHTRTENNHSTTLLFDV